MLKSNRILLIIILSCISTSFYAENKIKTHKYYFDSENGSDQNTGIAEKKPFKSLSIIKSLELIPGDVILLKRGSVFNNQVIELINQKGKVNNPIRVGAYGKGLKPKIDLGALTKYAINISSSEYIEISDIEITGGSGGVQIEWVNQKVKFSHFVFSNLSIHDCFQSNGCGFHINMIPKGKTRMSEYCDILIQSCDVKMIARDFIHAESLENVIINKNDFKSSGGPGVVIGKSSKISITNNCISSSGSKAHPSFNGRGSCVWVIGCKNGLIENNVFENARGWLDSYGCHLDIGNSDIIVQRNLSRNNAGGFVQVLGKNSNCAYRYNISINDGWRVKGVFDHPTEKNIQDGCVISLYGFVANGKFEGPYNTYIYNNTIYVNDSIEAGFNFRGTIRGAFIANNIFHIVGKSKEIKVNKNDREPEIMPENVIFKNNLYLKDTNLPVGMMVEDTQKIIGDANFSLSGGLTAENYMPLNSNLIKNKSIEISLIPGDKKGLKTGFNMKCDFLGNKIAGIPDLGAIEIK